MHQTIQPALATLLASVVLCLGALPAKAALSLIYETTFDSPGYADSPLIGQDGWVITGTTTTNPIAIANTAVNGNVTLATSGQDANRPFTPSLNSGSVYLKASINVTSAQTGDYFLHLGDGSTNNFYARLYVKSSGTGFVMGMTTSSPSASGGNPAIPVNYGTTEVAFSSLQTVLLRYDFVPGPANDTGALFLNPSSDDGTLDTPYIPATFAGSDAVAISGVNFRQGGSTSSPAVTIENLAVSVPEPSVTLLALLAGMGLTSRRR